MSSSKNSRRTEMEIPSTHCTSKNSRISTKSHCARLKAISVCIVAEGQNVTNNRHNKCFQQRSIKQLYT
jgi:hypothetical protein